MTEFWHWWLGGAIALALAPLAPAAVLVWLALAAILVGLIVLLLPQTSITLQWVLFGALAVAVWFGWRLIRHGTVGGSRRRR